MSAGTAAADTIGVVLLVVVVELVLFVTAAAVAGNTVDDDTTVVVVAVEIAETVTALVTAAAASVLLLVLMLVADASSTSDDSFSFFSLLGAVTSSFGIEGLLILLGLVSALWVNIEDLSGIISLIGGRLPKVLLFCAKGFASDKNELVLVANSGFSIPAVFQSIREPEAPWPLTRLFEKMLFSTGSFLVGLLLEFPLGVST